MKESDLSRSIKLRLKREYPGCFIFKSAGGPHQERGLPDLIGCIQGHFVGIEVKLGTKYGVTPLQQAALDDIRRSGGIAGVVYSADEAVALVKECLEHG